MILVGGAATSHRLAPRLTKSRLPVNGRRVADRTAVDTSVRSEEASVVSPESVIGLDDNDIGEF